MSRYTNSQPSHNMAKAFLTGGLYLSLGQFIPETLHNPWVSIRKVPEAGALSF